MDKDKEAGGTLLEYAIVMVCIALVVVTAFTAIIAAAGPLGDILPSLLGL